MIDTSVLEELGLSGNEIKVYLALLETGSTRAGGIINRTGLPNSVAHLTLGQLVRKGLASFILHENIRFFQAAEPRTLLRFVDEKRLRLETAVSQMLLLQKTTDRQEAEIFEGLAGFRTMLYKSIEDAKRGDEYLFFAFSCSNPELTEQAYVFYEQFRKERLRRGLVLKGIGSTAARASFRRTGFDTRTVLFVNYPILENVSICRDKVIMTPWDDRPISFLVTSAQMAASFKGYFYSIWNRRRIHAA